MPGDDLSTLAAHTDCSVIVLSNRFMASLTNAFDTNSMFICDKEESSRFYESVLHGRKHHVNLSNSTYISVNRGDFLVFPPTLIHGNSINTTDFTYVFHLIFELSLSILRILDPWLATECLAPITRSGILRSNISGITMCLIFSNDFYLYALSTIWSVLHTYFHSISLFT